MSHKSKSNIDKQLQNDKGQTNPQHGQLKIAQHIINQGGFILIDNH